MRSNSRRVRSDVIYEAFKMINGYYDSGCREYSSSKLLE